ncbi:Hypothetical predicted protein, partial [Cloeon dipterum]
NPLEGSSAELINLLIQHETSLSLLQ